MKFLCMTCDDPMNLQKTEGPHQGSMSVVFQCDGCGWQMAMLTNPMETQAVRSLGVKIGGATVPAEPMEMLRSNLTGVRADLAANGEGSAPAQAAEADAGNEDGAASKCPFSQMLQTGSEETPTRQEFITSVAAPPPEPSSEGVAWTDAAKQRIEERIPSFIRPMARVAIEKYAEEKGYSEINEDVLEETRGMFAA
jgi:hypothetical protein